MEAARAGEAGSGFAVVADEVRNLAMRTTDAARDTAALIEGTINKVHYGSELVTRTNEAFNKVAERTLKIDGLLNEIAFASIEQSQGIEQVSITVSDIDRAIQQNSSNAQESASASKEMTSQVKKMQSSVQKLVTLVNGRRNAIGKGQYDTSRRTTVEAKKSPLGIKDNKDHHLF